MNAESVLKKNNNQINQEVFHILEMVSDLKTYLCSVVKMTS